MQDSPYQIGGSLPKNASTYVVRQADNELYQGLKSGQFCYVLNSRQMGKSSLLVQTMQRLQSEGIACATIDISDIGNQQVSLEKWYGGVAYKLLSSFNLFNPLEFMSWWQERELISPVQRLSELIEEVLLAQISESIVIFIDEIDSVLSLKEPLDDFFALIRACYNKRAQNPDYQRLTFALLGVATPSDLITNPTRTPFNIGRAIELHGFQVHEVQPLEKGLEDEVDNPSEVLKEIIHWTGGQPFLTQKLCQLVIHYGKINSEKGNLNSSKLTSIVKSHLIENWESQDEPAHLKTIRDRILSNPQRASRLLGLYQKILQQGTINADDTPEQAQLRLSGLVVRRDGKLSIYNQIYQLIFNLSWVEQALFDLRPYAESLDAWLASNCQDESRLLRGQALQDAQRWASGKSLNDRDYQFLAASQESELAQLRKNDEQSQAEIERLCREKELLEKLANEQEQRKLTEVKLQHEQEQKLRIITSASGAVLSILAFLIGVFWVTSSSTSMNNKLNALSSYSEVLLDMGQTDEALRKSLKAGNELKQSMGVSSEAKIRVLTALNQAVYSFKELNRLPGHTSQVRTVNFSPDNKSIASIDANGTLKLWQRNGTLLFTINGVITEKIPPFHRLSFSPDSQTLAFITNDNTIQLLHHRGKVWQEKPQPFNPHSSTVTSLSFSSKGQVLASGNADGTIKLWRIEKSSSRSPAILLQTLQGHQSWVTSLSF
ncbi:MAG TPA: AAA-like domain-containing protein, partial [Coleofasciculaceae cyanobacterium]